MKAKNETVEAIRELQRVWNTVYAAALKKGPHNPKGLPERAEQLARSYMSGYLRIPLKH